MILHLSCDDQFVRYIDKQFLGDKISSRLVVCDYKKSPQLAKYAPHMSYIQVGTKEYSELKISLGNYKGVIFHGLFGRWSEELIDAVPAGVTIAWVCWDAEIFARPDMEYHYQKPLTYALKSMKSICSILRHGLKNKIPYFVKKEKFFKIKYCLCDMPQEAFEANKYLKTQMEWLPYNYYSIKETLGDLQYEQAKGPNILLGNACSFGNNHIDAFWQLRPLINSTQKVITPLSYGDIGIRKYILYIGKKMLGSAFVPLLDYLPINDYNKKMLSCSVMIQNQCSPRALGNIITGLWLGMRLYLSKKNITYDFLKSLGVYVYTMEDNLNRNNPNVFTALSEYEVSHNRKMLEMYYGDEITKLRVNNIIGKLNN